MFCTECGKKLQPENHFCGNCGHEVDKPSFPEPQPASLEDEYRALICPVCAHPWGETDTSCPDCGSSITALLENLTRIAAHQATPEQKRLLYKQLNWKQPELPPQPGPVSSLDKTSAVCQKCSELNTLLSGTNQAWCGRCGTKLNLNPESIFPVASTLAPTPPLESKLVAHPVPAPEQKHLRPIPVKDSNAIDTGIRNSSPWIALLGGVVIALYIMLGSKGRMGTGDYVSSFLIWTVILWAVIQLFKKAMEYRKGKKKRFEDI